MIALNAPRALWLAGEGANPEVFGAKFTELTPYTGDDAQKQANASAWIMRR